jgi:hypothetical protein
MSRVGNGEWWTGTLMAAWVRGSKRRRRNRYRWRRPAHSRSIRCNLSHEVHSSDLHFAQRARRARRAACRPGDPAMKRVILAWPSSEASPAGLPMRMPSSAPAVYTALDASLQTAPWASGEVMSVVPLTGGRDSPPQGRDPPLLSRLRGCPAVSGWNGLAGGAMSLNHPEILAEGETAIDSAFGRGHVGAAAGHTGVLAKHGLS